MHSLPSLRAQVRPGRACTCAVAPYLMPTAGCVAGPNGHVVALCRMHTWPCRGLCRDTVPCLMPFPSHDTLCVLRYNSPAIKPLPQPRYRICIVTQLFPQPNLRSCHDTTNYIVTFSPTYCTPSCCVMIQFPIVL